MLLANLESLRARCSDLSPAGLRYGRVRVGQRYCRFPFPFMPVDCECQSVRTPPGGNPVSLRAASGRRMRGGHRYRASVRLHDRHRCRQCRRARIPEPDRPDDLPGTAEATGRSARSSNWNSCRSGISGWSWEPRFASHDIAQRSRLRGSAPIILAGRFRGLALPISRAGRSAVRPDLCGGRPRQPHRRDHGRAWCEATEPNSRWRSTASLFQTSSSPPST